MSLDALTEIPAVAPVTTPPPFNPVADGIAALIRDGRKELLRNALDTYPNLVDYTDINGRTWMHLAAEYGVIGCVDVLRDVGCPVTATDVMGETPLHRALGRGREDMALHLLSVKADPNAASIYDVTPAHLAAALSNTMLAAVIQSGGNPSTKDRFGRGVKEWADLAAHQAALAALEVHAANAPTRDDEATWAVPEAAPVPFAPAGTVAPVDTSLLGHRTAPPIETAVRPKTKHP